jgi:hypothetical protein
MSRLTTTTDDDELIFSQELSLCSLKNQSKLLFMKKEYKTGLQSPKCRRNVPGSRGDWKITYSGGSVCGHESKALCTAKGEEGLEMDNKGNYQSVY